jgi:cell division protein FtsB
VRIQKILSFSIILIIIIISVYQIYKGPYGIIKSKEFKRDIKQEQEKVQKLNQKILALKEKISNISSDDFEIERIAREDLLMGATNEIIYLLPPGYS